MAFQYLTSANVHMFPSSMRTGTTDVYSRFTTELNLVNIINRVSTGKFVSKSYSDGGNLWIDFTLLGYHFEANIQSLIAGTGALLDTGDHLYACAIIGYASPSNTTYTENKYDEILKGWSSDSIQTSVDLNGNFVGLLFTKVEADCTGLATTIESITGWSCTCDYIDLGVKGSGTAEFNVNTTDKPFDTDNIESISDATINSLWG